MKKDILKSTGTYRDVMIWSNIVLTVLTGMSIPCINKMVYSSLDTRLLAAINIIDYVAVIVSAKIWGDEKRQKTLYKHFAKIVFVDILALATVLITTVITGSVIMYLVIFEITYVIITRNVCAGNRFLTSYRYTGKNRAQYDNTLDSACAIGSMLGSGIACLIPDPNFKVMVFLYIVSIIISDFITIVIYHYENRKDKNHGDIV